jgi:hypothetical protein
MVGQGTDFCFAAIFRSALPDAFERGQDAESSLMIRLIVRSTRTRLTGRPRFIFVHVFELMPRVSITHSLLWLTSLL